VTELALVRSDEELFDDAIKAEAEASSNRWRAADDYAELHGRGYSTRKIGKRVGKSQAHIVFCLKAVSDYPGNRPRADFQDAYEEAQGKTTAEQLVQSNENEWHTPKQYIEAARRVLGTIDLDPASSALANETVRANQFFTVADHPFSHNWKGNVWLNPPYGGLGGAFVSRLVDEYFGGNATAAIALVNAHCTDTQWFRPLFNQPLCFTDHRIDFDSAGREKATTSTHGSVFAYFGPDEELFIAEFGIFGPVVRPA
jgi:hypothetical protein